MENVLSAFVALFTFLFAVLTLSGALMSSQSAIGEAMQAMQARAEVKARTHLTPVYALSGGSTGLAFVFRNDGETKLVDFAEWDAFVEYTDGGGALHIDRLSYSDEAPGADQWSLEGIYLDAQRHITEILEPDILNPGEEMLAQVNLSAALGLNQTIWLTLTTPNGVTATTFFTPEAPPALAKNLLLKAKKQAVTTIDNAHLASADSDDLLSDLVYSIVTPPAQGTLNLGNTFTQLAIDNGLLAYTHTGETSDSFTFTVSDGKTTIGAYVFTIIIGEPPALEKNLGITVEADQTVVIDNTLLATSDPDDPPARLVYTVATPPSLGMLNLGDSFTQAAIDSGLLSYTRTAAGADSFTFTVSDGQTTIGPYTFTIMQPEQQP